MEDILALLQNEHGEVEKCLNAIGFDLEQQNQLRLRLLPTADEQQYRNKRSSRSLLTQLSTQVLFETELAK